MFKKLKSLFVIEDEDSKSKAQQQTGQEAQNTKNQNPVKVVKPTFDSANPPKGKVDEKFVNRLLGAIEEGNLDGFDYLEYKQAMQNLSKVEMDEATKYKSALAMAKTMGATPDSLLSAAQHYIKLLEKEEQKFLEAFKNQLSRQQNDSKEKLKNLESGIKLKNKKIEELKKEIESNTKELDKLNSAAETTKAKVESTKNSFYHAYHIVSRQILDDIEKMKKYLK